MALQSTGSIKFSQLQAEFGGSSPIKLSEYYRGGAYVANDPFVYQGVNGNIPASGAIPISRFFGTTKGASYSNYYSSTSFTPPANVRKIQVYAVGGGGGGCSAAGSAFGGGGGGGGFSSGTVNISGAVSITVGGGGSGGVYSTVTGMGDGTAGGTSVVSSVSAQGGRPGYSVKISGADGKGGAGGTGSTANGANGTDPVRYTSVGVGGAAGAGHPIGGTYGQGGNGGGYASQPGIAGTQGYVRIRY